jgi:Cu/Ag efflux pump CusA
VLALAGLALLPALATPSMIPTLRDRNLLIRWEGAPGTSQPEMVRITDRASDELRAIPGVRRVGAHIGRAVTSDQVVGINAGEIWVSLAGNADYGPTVGAIQRVLDNYPGVTHALQTYTEQRTRQELTGAVDPLVVRIYGEDLGTLRAKADEVRHLLAGVRGVSAAHVAEQAEEPTVEIEVNLAAAQRHGVKPGDVRRAAATVLSGIQVGSLFEQQKVFDVVVRGAPAVRHDLGSVNDLLIDTPDHRQVRLAEVATVRIRPAPSAIRHDAVSRSIDVGAAVGGRSLSSVQDEVRARLRGVSFPLEYHAELVGDSAQRTDGRRLLILGLAAAIGALLLLQSAFGGWRLAGAFLLTLPTALAGGALAALLAGGPPSLATLFGLLGALAVAARTGVLLIRHCQRLAEDGEPHGPGLVLRAVRERIAPILITALATGAAVLPLILLGGSPGLEVLRPVAVALLGGLVTATVFTLFVVPLLYLGLGATDRPTQPSTREPEVSEAGT